MLAALEKGQDAKKCCFSLFYGTVQECGMLGKTVNEDTFIMVPTWLF